MEIDYAGIWSKLKGDCQICDWAYYYVSNCLCKDCPFICGSFGTSKSVNKMLIRPAIGKKFKGLGIDDSVKRKIGKHQLYYFLYHPWLNFSLPEKPLLDMFGNPVKDSEDFVIHHLNGHFFDDRKHNLLLCFPIEHKYLEKRTRKVRKAMVNKELYNEYKKTKRAKKRGHLI